MKFDFALWSSKAIQEYVKRTMGIEISRRTARRYMNKLGFTYKVPERRAKEQNSETVNKWLNDTYPKIRCIILVYNLPKRFDARARIIVH